MGPGSWVHPQKLAEQQPPRLQAIFSIELFSSGKLHAPLQVCACLVLMCAGVCQRFLGLFAVDSRCVTTLLLVAIVGKGNPRKR